MLTLAICSLSPLKAVVSYVLPWDLILRKQTRYLICNLIIIFYGLIKGYDISLTLNSDIQGSFEKFLLLFRQAKMIVVIIWLSDHFTLQPVPSVNSIWMITFVNHLHVWVTKFKPLLMFFQLLILTPNNAIWVNFSAILFNETQQVVKASTAGYGPVCCEVINLFIKPQKFLLMSLLSKLEGFYLIIFFFDGLLIFFLHFVCKLLSNMRKQHIAAVSPEVFLLPLVVDLKILSHTSPLH